MSEARTKYAREICILANKVAKIQSAASTDAALTSQEREDVVWEITRLRAAAADTVAAILGQSKFL
jgi:hypothetical protein